MSYYGQNSLEKLNYKQIQKISKNLKLPSNYKKQQLIDIIYAKMKGDESEVGRLVDLAKKERGEAHKRRYERRLRIQAGEVSSTMASRTSPTPVPTVVIDHRPKASLRYPRRDRSAAIQFRGSELPNQKTRLEKCCEPSCPSSHDAMASDDFIRERIQFPIYNKFGVNIKRLRQNTDDEPSSSVDCITKRKPILRSLLQPSIGNDCSLLVTRYLNVAQHADSKLTISTQLKSGLSTSMNQEISEGPLDYTKKSSSDDGETNNYVTNAPHPKPPRNSTNKDKKAYYENRNLFEKTYIRYRPYKQDFDKFIFLYRRRLRRLITSQTDNDTNVRLNGANNVDDAGPNSVDGSNNIILDNNLDSTAPAEGVYRDDVYMLQMDSFVSGVASDQTRRVLEAQRNEPDYLNRELGDGQIDTTSSTVNNADVANLCKDICMDSNDLLLEDETTKHFVGDDMNVYYHKKMRAKMSTKERPQCSNSSEEASTEYGGAELPLPHFTQAFSQFVPHNNYENCVENIVTSLPLDIGMIVETYDQNSDNCSPSVHNFRKDTMACPMMPTQEGFPETVTNYKQECVSPPLAHQNIEPTNNIFYYDGPVSSNSMVPYFVYPNNSPRDVEQDENQNRFIGNNNQVSYPLIYEYLQSSEKEVLLKRGFVADNNNGYNTSLEDLAGQIEDFQGSDSNNNAADLDLLQYSDTNLGASVTVPDLDENALSFIYEETAYPSTNQDVPSECKGTEDDGGTECCFCDWAGRTSSFESHIRQNHQSDISTVHTAEFEQEMSLGTLINWPSNVLATVLEYRSQLLLLRAKHENPDFILASLAMIPSESKDETPFDMASISVFNKVTGEPFSWRGALSPLRDSRPFQSANTFLRIQISQLDLLPNSANIVVLNGKLVPLSPSQVVICGQIHLNDIVMKFHFSLFKDS